MANQENFTTGNISELKQIIEKLTNTVTKQNLVIQNLTDCLEKLENNQITSENNIYQLEKRLTAVERYQNRPFLIFTNIDIPADGNVLAPILQIVNNILQVSLNPDEISIAHPLKNGNIAPIIVQFLYLQQRDIILKRASWLRGLRNSMGNPIFIHERLAKKDVIIEKKARELDIHYKIRKSHLWAFDGERYQPVDDISELPDYQRRQQKSLQTVQNGTPFMNNKRTYAFSPDMDATNNGNDIPMNKKQNMYGDSFQQNKSYASKN